MSLRLEPLTKDALNAMLAEPRVKKLYGNLTDGQIETMLRSGHELWDGDDLLAVGGAILLWPGRAEGWAIFTRKHPHKFIKAVRLCERVLKASPIRRIEAWTWSDFAQGHWFLRHLGFKLEAARMEGFTPDGKSAALYARVKDA